MYEFTLENRKTTEINTVFGRNIDKALERAGLNPDEWKVLFADYID